MGGSQEATTVPGDGTIADAVKNRDPLGVWQYGRFCRADAGKQCTVDVSGTLAKSSEIDRRNAASGLDDPITNRIADQLAHRMQSELVHHMPAVRFGRLRADAKEPGDLLVA